jgi:hypothetical protein
VVKLKAVDKQLVVHEGKTLECRLELERTPNFTGPMEVELRAPHPGFSADPVTIQANQTAAVVHVHVPANRPPHANTTLRFRARGQLPTSTPIVSEATLNVVWK